MKILFLGRADLGNTCNRIARGMNARAGRTIARVLTHKRHTFRFEEDLWLHDKPNEVHRPIEWAAGELGDFLDDCAIASTGDGHYGVLDSLTAQLNLRDRPFIAVQSGGEYRKPAKARAYDLQDNRRGYVARFIYADLMRMTSPLVRNQFAFIGSCGGIAAPDVVAARKKLIVCHSPANQRTQRKNTMGIQRVVMRVRHLVHYREVVGLETAAEVTAARAGAEIFVDHLTPSLGNIGCSSVEAMASGCLLVTNIKHVSQGYWGDAEDYCVHVRNEADLEDRLRYYADHRDELLEARIRCVEWARREFSDDRVAKFWMDALGMK